MKMYAFYTITDIPYLEYNHRKYCEINNIEYNKVVISDTLAEKYAYILQFLQQNPQEIIYFIDDMTFFKKMDQIFYPKDDFLIQKDGKKILDSFFVVKSTPAVVSLVQQILLKINKNDFNTCKYKKTRNAEEEFFENLGVEYLYQENNVYFNVCPSRHKDFNFNQSNIVALNFHNTFPENESKYFAEVMCIPNVQKYDIPSEAFECFNPGYPTAFVSLYTPNIAQAGIISEKNIKKFCLKNNITYYIYRDIIPSLKNQNISGAWCKPWLLLNHFNMHRNIAWIDSDILLSKNYTIDVSKPMIVYMDPNYKFNSGYMMFETTDKNKELLELVIKKIEKIDGILEGVYNHGGDQPRFIEATLEIYPDLIPLSANLGNTHPVFPVSVSPYKKDVMLHFMGFDYKMRIAIMSGYNEIMLQQYYK